MTARHHLDDVRNELKHLFIERDQVVDGALIAVLSRQHMLMLGPPGTAKSMLAKEVCRRMGGTAYFEWLLTKFTTPEEIFGPVSLPALENGRYERVVTNKLPEAQVAFLDEIFKANSAILNALLTILNERRFHNADRSLQVPLESMFAASNELPEEDELGALYDRFLLRFTVGYIERDHLFLRLLSLPDDIREPASGQRQKKSDVEVTDDDIDHLFDEPDTIDADLEVTVLERSDLADLQAQVLDVDVPGTVLEDILEIRRDLTTEGVIASDRRYRQALIVLRASALLDGRGRVDTADLAWLEHILWSDPDERPKVVQAVARVASGFEDEARRLLAQAEEIAAYGRRSWPDLDSRNRALIEAHTKLAHIQKRLEDLSQAGRSRARDTSQLDDMTARVVAMQQGLIGVKN